MYLVTGAAGFIGFHLCENLLQQNVSVIGLDNLNDYYDINLKNSRLNLLKQYPNFKFEQIDVADKERVFAFMSQHSFEYIIHLAAQPGVRYSTINPYIYTRNNIDAQLVMLEATRHTQPNIKHFIFASSSSVYGGNTKIPFAEVDAVMQPVSLYAATKLAQEHTAYSYNQMYKIPISGLRFFTVYGPYGRPDMAVYDFTDKIFHNQAITVYGKGLLKRDFTYIDDIISGITSLINLPKKSDYQIYNLGHHQPVTVNEVLAEIEQALNKKAIINYQEKPIGDVDLTYADITKSMENLNFNPQTSISLGVKKFVDWYLKYAHNEYNI